jgi:hypothetical protein
MATNLETQINKHLERLAWVSAVVLPVAAWTVLGR